MIDFEVTVAMIDFMVTVARCVLIVFSFFSMLPVWFFKVIQKN